MRAHDFLTDMRALLSDYGKLRKLRSTEDAPGSWPDLELVAVRVTDERNLEPLGKGEWDKLAGKAGWARFRSAVAGGPHDYKPDAKAEIGDWLVGEWAVDDATSMHLREDPDAPGRVMLVTFKERVLKVEDNLAEDEQPFLRQRVAVLADRRPDVEVKLSRSSTHKAAIYHVYWGVPEGAIDHSAIRRVAYRFVGFCDEKLTFIPEKSPTNAETRR